LTRFQGLGWERDRLLELTPASHFRVSLKYSVFNCEIGYIAVCELTSQDGTDFHPHWRLEMPPNISNRLKKMGDLLCPVEATGRVDEQVG
jgi:hypothetical protein